MRKDLAEGKTQGTADSRKDVAEGFPGRTRGRKPFELRSKTIFFLSSARGRKSAEGSAEGFRGRIRGRIPNNSGRIPEGFRKDPEGFRTDLEGFTDHSAEGFRGRIRGRIPRKDPGRIRGRISAEGRKVAHELKHNRSLRSVY